MLTNCYKLLYLEIWANKQDRLGRPCKFPKKHTNVDYNLSINCCCCFGAWLSNLPFLPVRALTSFLRQRQTQFLQSDEWHSGLQTYSLCERCKYFSIIFMINSLHGSFHHVFGVECYIHWGHFVQGKATPVTSGKWEVIFISKLTKDAMWVMTPYISGKTTSKINLNQY